MIFFFILLFFLILRTTRFNFTNLNSALSISHTQSIKGIFVITIFFSHYCSYVNLEQWYDKLLQSYCEFLGQLMVVPFLFYSGFGIFESVKNKGLNYIKSFPQKRILKTLIHFDFAIILFLLLDLFIKRPISISNLLLSLIAWEDIGNSNWFIFAILNAYTFAFIGLSLFKGKLKHSLFFIITMSLVYIALVSQFKATHWFDTFLAFPLGCTFSVYKEKIDSIMHNRIATLSGAILCIFILLFIKYAFIPLTFISSQIALLAFSTTIVFLSLHFYINSKILDWFGANVFGIYILQRIPMNYFSYLHLNDYSIYLFFVICFICTMALTILFSMWNNLFDKIFLNATQS